MAGQFQFVTVSDPMEPASSKSRKLMHSHVMRQAHAKKRRWRTQRYQSESMIHELRQDLTVFKPLLSNSVRQLYTNGKDPFSSLARPLTSEEYFLLDHYIQVVIPYSIGHCDLFNCPGDHREQMLREWVGLAITDDALMVAAVLLSTCRYILIHQPGHPVYSRMALQYKQTCIRTLRQEISADSSSLNAMTVAKAVALAIDEANSGEHDVARKHLQGALAMVRCNGGAQSFGLTGLLERMYHKLIVVFRVRDGDVDLP